MWAIISLTRIKNALVSVRFKFTIAYLLLSFVALALIAVITLQQVGESLLTRAQQDADALCSYYAGYVNVGKNEVADSFYNVLDASRVLTVDENGVVQYDSESESNGRKPELKEGAFLSASVPSLRYPGAYVTGVYIYEAKGGKVIVARSLDPEYRLCREAAYKIIPVTAAVYIMCAVFMLAAVRVFTMPFYELNEGIRRMSAGDFSTRVDTTNMDNEFTALAEAFNEMMNRVETLDRSRNSFVSNASHELKTPLATMKVMIESILYQEVLDEAITKEFLTDANNEIDRLSNIITDLLSLVSMDSGESRLKVSSFDISALVNSVVRKLGPLARQRGLDLRYTGPEKLDIQADSARLTEVFINLIDNALKYTPRPGSVQVEVAKVSNSAVIKVADTGIGISENDQKHIFDRFYRVDKARSRATGGTGLGLSITKQIILMHNGTISVSSMPEKGTVFTVKLPLVAERSK